MIPLLETTGLGKTYETPAGPVPVLRGIDWQLNRGEFCAITGPSGSGKTTLLNLISFLDSPTAGSIHFNGVRINHADEREQIRVRKHLIGMIFQKFCLLPHRSALENVLFRARYAGADFEACMTRARSLLEEFGLAHLADREARLLSGGEMQRVAIARALLVKPELLVADEPTGNLDREASETVMRALSDIHASGIAVLLVTHNRSLLSFASSHYECREGRLWREK